MKIKSKKIFQLLIKEISELPLWIKQIIYMSLKDEFESAVMKTYQSFITKDNCLQFYIPQLTYSGKSELEQKARKYPEEIYNFLEGAFQELSMTEIAITNNWNFLECSKFLLDTISNDLIVNPNSSLIKGTALYMSGKIRLGEYFVKIGKISIEQLDEALRTQKYIEGSVGDKPGLADVLIELGFLTREETEGILILKKDCTKHYKSTFLDNEEVVLKTE